MSKDQGFNRLVVQKEMVIGCQKFVKTQLDTIRNQMLKRTMYSRERAKKSGDNYSLSADFLANSPHIMAGVSTVWHEL